MKSLLYKKFKDRVIVANKNDTIWYAGFYFVNLTAKQAEDLRKSTLDKWGDDNGVVRFPNGISIKPITETYITKLERC